SYSDQNWQVNAEGTSAVQLFPTFFANPPSSVVLPNVASTHASNYNFTEEARLATAQSIAGFDGLIGVYYKKDHTPNQFFWNPPDYNAVVAGNDPTNPLYAPDNNLFSSWGADHHRETSVFGELTYHFTDSLSLTGGMR